MAQKPAQGVLTWMNPRLDFIQLGGCGRPGFYPKLCHTGSRAVMAFVLSSCHIPCNVAGRRAAAPRPVSIQVGHLRIGPVPRSSSCLDPAFVGCEAVNMSSFYVLGLYCAHLRHLCAAARCTGDLAVDLWQRKLLVLSNLGLQVLESRQNTT